MSESMGAPPDGAREATPPPGRIVRSLRRAAGSTAVLVAIYYLLPLDHSARWVAVTALVIGLAVLVGLVAFQLRAIRVSRCPGVRARETLGVTVRLFLLRFASTYLGLAALSARSFSQPMNHPDAL